MKLKLGYGPWFLARIFVGLVFAYAGFSKLMEPVENFRAAILQYGIIPYNLAVLIATVLPWIELVFGIFFILGFAIRPSAIVLGLCSLGFLLVLGASNVLLEGGPSDCGCFGEGGLIHLTVHQVFALDIVNSVLSLKLFSIKTHFPSIDSFLNKSFADN